MILVSAIVAMIAGVLFRPDNGVMLSLFRTGVMARKRKTIHRCLMIFSLTWFVYAFFWFFDLI